MKKDKKCPKCGIHLNETNLICPNCGFDFKAVSAIGSDTISNHFKYNLDVNIPEIISVSLNEDVNVQQIAAYKQSMGFSSRIDNIVFAQNYNRKQPLSFIWDLLIAKSYVISFEKTGILFIGVGDAGQLTGENAYLTDADIKEFDFRYGFGKRVITIRSVKGLLKLSCPLTIKQNTFQKQNLAKLGELTDHYNVWIDLK